MERHGEHPTWWNAAYANNGSERELAMLADMVGKLPSGYGILSEGPIVPGDACWDAMALKWDLGGFDFECDDLRCWQPAARKMHLAQLQLF
jgi:hypothetical protein